MSIYDEMQSVAKELLGSDDFAQAGIKYIALVKGAGSPDNPGKPTEVLYTIADAVARGVEYKYVDGTQIVTSDGQVTCGAPQSFTPKIGDWVEVGGKRHKIKMCTAVPPTGTPVVYKLIYER